MRVKLLLRNNNWYSYSANDVTNNLSQSARISRLQGIQLFFCVEADIAAQAKDSSTTFLVTSKKYAAKSMEVNILTQGRIKVCTVLLV